MKLVGLALLFCSTLWAQSLPRSFRVGHQDWTIAPRRSPMVMNQMEVQGYTDCQVHRIYLEVPHPPTELADSLFHELLHAATGCADDITDIHGGMHGAIWQITEPLRQILANNPRLTQYVFQRR